MGSVPLPLNYPANLIYAQNMLAMSTVQLQRLETQKAKLQLLLKDLSVGLHRKEAGSLDGINIEFLAGLEPEGITNQNQGIDPTEGQRVAHAGGENYAPGLAAEAAAAGVGGGGGGVAAAAAAAAVGRRREVRRRLADALKVMLAMLVFEVPLAWFFVHFFVVFLYVTGVLDPAIEWFSNQRGQVTLEQRLAELRQRQLLAEDATVAMAAAERVRAAQAAQRGIAEASSGAVPAEAVAVAGTDSSGAAAAPAPASGTAEPSANAADTDGTASAQGVQEGGLGTGAGAAAVAEESGNAAGNAAAGNALNGAEGAADPDLPPYGIRFFYQLVFMFVMTLIPWWNPDPRYIQ